jgi:threonine dehydrogenase-like Zn-dependent dehydrogenase
MRELWFSGIGAVEVREVEPPGPPGTGEVLLAPTHVGVCGSDLSLLHGHHPWIRPPVVPGHEVTATVVETGDDVPALRRGDRVLLNPLVHCGTCRACLRGRFNACESAKVIGFRRPGAARSLVLHPAHLLHRIPPDVGNDLACLAEPLACGFHAASRATDLEDCLVIGGGSIGLSLLLALGARGAGRVTVVEPTPAKRDLSLRLGAHAAAAPEDLDRVTGPRFTSAFDCVSRAGTLATALDSVCGGGTVVVVGVPEGPGPLPLARMQRYEVDLVGSGMYLPADVDAALAHVARRPDDVRALLSRTYPLEQAARAYAAAGTAESVKLLIRMTDDG